MGTIFIDSNDNQFNTLEEAEKFYGEEFKNEVLKDFEALSEYLECGTTWGTTEIMEWIFKDHPEILPDFYKKFSSVIEEGKEDYIDNRLWDLEKIED